eukprot:Sdes_comp15883_c0_seq1m4991
MGRLDASLLRYMGRDEFRVLTSVEMGSKNHEIVPVTLIAAIAALKTGGALKILQELQRHRLVEHDKKQYNGYRLTTLGYDYLSLKTMTARGSIQGLGHIIGVGKESDVFIVNDANEKQLALKFHRLGRTSFRAGVKEKRDYLNNNTKRSSSWLYLSRQAAMKEFAFMKALHQVGYPVPLPVDYSRHAICMQLVDGFPLNQLQELDDCEKLYSDLMNLIVQLADLGLIHGDFNEFNLMINQKGEITVIDFPQMVSIRHQNAKFYFDRDVQCIRDFFLRKFSYKNDSYPVFEKHCLGGKKNLDLELKATGAFASPNHPNDDFAMISADFNHSENWPECDDLGQESLKEFLSSQSEDSHESAESDEFDEEEAVEENEDEIGSVSSTLQSFSQLQMTHPSTREDLEKEHSLAENSESISNSTNDAADTSSTSEIKNPQKIRETPLESRVDLSLIRNKVKNHRLSRARKTEHATAVSSKKNNHQKTKERKIHREACNSSQNSFF